MKLIPRELRKWSYFAKLIFLTYKNYILIYFVQVRDDYEIFNHNFEFSLLEKYLKIITAIVLVRYFENVY